MTLVIDTGVLLAALDRDDDAHRPCRDLLDGATEQLAIPELTLPELDYWFSKRLSPGVAVDLLDEIIAGAFEIVRLTSDDYPRIREICATYLDAGVGVVDASVLATVERLGETKLATLDRRHFSVLRPRHVASLDLLPA